MRLFIENRELELPSGFNIPRTKQVNDIVSLDDRQSDFTQKIKIPRTPKNEIAMRYLGLNGDTTDIPYSISDARLVQDSGESEIQSGRMVVMKTNTDYYEVVLYNGYVNFLKIIENKTLREAGLSELNHIKNLTTVIETWDNDLNYIYNIADYNGLNSYNSNTVNIDYMIPSVKKSYLFDRIFDFAGWTYEGSVFATDDWINNWMTYPKAIGDGSQVTTAVHTWNFRGTLNYQTNDNPLTYRYSQRFTHSPLVNNSYLESPPLSGSFPEPTGAVISVLTTGLYKFVFDGQFSQNDIDLNFDVVIFIKDANGGTRQERLIEDYTQGENLNPDEEVYYVFLNEGDTFILQPTNAGEDYVLTNKKITGSIDIDVSIVEGNAIDFEEALIDFEMKDFIDELLWEFSLTPFVNDAEKHIIFLTSEEWLNNTERLDWSSDKRKFSSFVEEEYVFGDYAQRNYFRHKYNESNADYNDGYLRVVNDNLKDKRDSIKSKIFTIEEERQAILFANYNTYKFWEKKPKDDGTVEYKPLKNRYYFQRSIAKSGSLLVGSQVLGTSQTVSNWNVEDHYNFKWKDIIPLRYLPMYSVLNTSRLVYANFYFDDISFRSFDFKPLYFIKELGSYFIFNKIPNYIEQGIYECELIEVDLGVTNAANDAQLPPRIVLTSQAYPNQLQQDWVIYNTVEFQNFEVVAATIKAVQYEEDENGIIGNPTGFEIEQNIIIPYDPDSDNMAMAEPLGSQAGRYFIQVTAQNGVQSNVTSVYVGTPPANPKATIYWGYDGELDGITDVSYIFQDFPEPPTYATLVYRRLNAANGQEQGPEIRIQLTNLAVGVLHTQTVDFGASGGYRGYMETDVVDSDYYSGYLS